LGEPGNLNELINKLCLDQVSRLAKKSIYRVLSEILIASPYYVKKEIRKGIEEICNAENLWKRELTH